MNRNILFFISIFVLFSFVVLPPIGVVDLERLFNYSKQEFPEKAMYRWNDQNPVTDMGATLGRVLFYDTQLSVNNTIACASCHQQENAFGDSRKTSIGFNGQRTPRHAMRLVNVDFGADNKKFWDERNSRLESMATLPIKDEIEMGFSGTNGFPGIDSLINRMNQIPYYKTLFTEAFGDADITEPRMGLALSQFIRSIITFDTKFDEGFNLIGEEITHFPNFTDAENRGKRLFFSPPAGIFGTRDVIVPTGAACGFCHKAPSFDLIHLSGNNGVIGVAGDSTLVDLSVTRSPSLKNLVKPDGTSNGPFMHDGSLETLEDVVDHYDFIPLDSRNDFTITGSLLFPRENGDVDLALTDEEKSDLITFLKTLSGNDLYTNEKWSNPFNEDGQLTLINCSSCSEENESKEETEEQENEGEIPVAGEDSIFSLFPWLTDHVDQEDCAGTTVEVYQQSIFQFIFITTPETTQMFFQDGQFYCQDATNFSCRDAYQLDFPITTWSCPLGDFMSNDNSLTFNSITDKGEFMSVYPNPSTGLFSVELPKRESESTIVVYDLIGNIVYRQSITDSSIDLHKIDLQDVNQGMYLIKYISESNQYSAKIFIQ